MSTQPLAPLEMAIAAAQEVLANVETAQMSTSTPCASWDVSGLINHMVGTHAFFVSGVTGNPPPAEADHSAGDYGQAFADAASALVAALQADGALEKSYKLPFGELPGGALMGLAATDTFQHAWDLAKATGQNTDLNPQLAAGLLEQSKKAISDGFRGPEGAPFGAAQEAPGGASAADQLAAFLGRQV